MSDLDWSDLARLAEVLSDPHAGPRHISDVEWRSIEQAIATLRQQQDWAGMIRLRVLLTDICTRDTFTGSALIRELEEEAIRAAEQLGDTNHLAIFWGDRGHNYHRQGFHRQALAAFTISSRYYEALGNESYVLRNHLMVALCHRALQHGERAHTIAVEILQKVPETEPWRGQPLQTLAWLYKDQGDWKKAEEFLREALKWQEQAENSEILVAGSLADLGELLSLQKRFAEAKHAFTRSLMILEKHQAQYYRQEARTKLKLAEMFLRQREYRLAMQSLKEADQLCCLYGHYYDQLWKIELVMARVLFRSGDYRSAVGKLASAFHIRRRLNLSTWLLVKQILIRFLRQRSR